MKILLGFEVRTGEPVSIPLHHLVVTGLTELSGKTTTLEALIRRSGKRAIAFKTRRGERGFSSYNEMLPYFKPRSDWQYVASMLEATMREKMKFERSWIIKACKGTEGKLEKVLENVEALRDKARKESLAESVYINLAEYLKLVLPELKRWRFSDKIDLMPGVNVMDLITMRRETQSLVIASVLEYVNKHLSNVIVVVPEAWEHLPEARMTPVKLPAEELVRAGRKVENYLWCDSQDITGMWKTILKSVDIWILGRQREKNEVIRTLDEIPLPRKQKPKPEEIMTLETGHFFVCYRDEVRKVYVQPAWLHEEVARRIALGEISVEEAYKYREKEDDDMWREKYEELKKKFEKFAKLEDLEEKYNRSIVEVERLASGYEALRKERDAVAKELGAYREENKKLQKRVNELLSTEKVGTLAAVKLGEKPISWKPGEAEKRTVELEAVELTVNVRHKEETVEMSTKTGLGKILYCAIHDLDKKPFIESETSGALAERGWYMAHSTLAPNLAQLVKQGYLIRIEKTRPQQYKLPSKLTINVAENLA